MSSKRHRERLIISRSQVGGAGLPELKAANCGLEARLEHQIDSLFMKTPARLPVNHGVENVILLIRGHRVMLDRDLANLYGVRQAT
jgi:hypothetical protein